TVEVNGDEPGNNFINARAAGERHKVPILVPVSELLEKLRAFAQAGFIIDSRIDAFAIGLVMGNSGRKVKQSAPPVSTLTTLPACPLLHLRTVGAGVNLSPTPVTTVESLGIKLS
ncbi:hypothetical protein FOCC_FOCC003113, partial [Frankliniella occidentalis]